MRTFARHFRPLSTTLAVLAFGVGCDARKPAASQPARSTQAEGGSLTLLAAESADWSRDEACAQLADPKLGLSAAVRLVRLSAAAPLCVPDELTDEHVRRLRLVSLGPALWALGLRDRGDKQRLLAPVLIRSGGEVAPLADGVDEEVLSLHVSADAEVFPHLAISPARVRIVGPEVVTAIELKSAAKVRFELRKERGFSYVALVLAVGGGRSQVARYRWDPYELTFMGPAIDKLPDPPGGRFEIDLDTSRRLEPVGGEIPEPEPNVEPRKPGEPPVPNENLPV